MDFSVITEHFDVVVVIGCLVVGYIIKTSFDKVPNKWIPTILGVLGAILNSVANGLSMETVIYGAAMGLAATGLHQAFKQFIENKDKED